MPLSVAFQFCRTVKPRLAHLVSWSELKKLDSFSPLHWRKWKAMTRFVVVLLQISLCANCRSFLRLILPLEAIQAWIQFYISVLNIGSYETVNEIGTYSVWSNTCGEYIRDAQGTNWLKLGPEYEQGGDVIYWCILKLGECLDSILKKHWQGLLLERQPCKSD